MDRTVEQPLHQDMDTGSVTAVVGGVATVAVAFLAGFWRWLGGSRKGSQEANAAVINGFVLLLAEFKNERTLLVARLDLCEAENQRLDRRVAQLESTLIQNRIPMPKEPKEPKEIEDLGI